MAKKEKVVLEAVRGATQPDAPAAAAMSAERAAGFEDGRAFEREKNAQIADWAAEQLNSIRRGRGSSGAIAKAKAEFARGLARLIRNGGTIDV